MNPEPSITIGKRKISLNSPTYFIADIASNHDGDLDRAKKLVFDAKEAGADAVKFQHFLAEDIVSDYGFKALGKQSGHQSAWKDSVFNTYKKYECNREWTFELYETAKRARIDFLTTPYDYPAVDIFSDLIPAFKIGSGDITWIEFLEYIAKKDKPLIISSGASSISDVERAVSAISRYNEKIALLQCNTNYTVDPDNFKYINLNVLKDYSSRFPGLVLGLSDHTPGYVTVLGAIALGARIIEKHFTDDCNRYGPDHQFSMNPESWKEMVTRSRELEMALGSKEKKIELNEKETVILQRRSLRMKCDKSCGSVLTRDDLTVLRPSPDGSVQPYDIEEVIGKKLKKIKAAGEAIYYSDLEEK